MVELRTLTQTSTSVVTSLEYILKNLIKLMRDNKSNWYTFKAIWRHKQEFYFTISKYETWYTLQVKWSDWDLTSKNQVFTTKVKLEEKIKEVLKWFGFSSRIDEDFNTIFSFEA